MCQIPKQLSYIMLLLAHCQQWYAFLLYINRGVRGGGRGMGLGGIGVHWPRGRIVHRNIYMLLYENVLDGCLRVCKLHTNFL